VLDPVRALQHALYRAAKADPERRFHALRDKVYRRDVLWRACGPGPAMSDTRSPSWPAGTAGWREQQPAQRGRPGHRGRGNARGPTPMRGAYVPMRVGDADFEFAVDVTLRF